MKKWVISFTLAAGVLGLAACNGNDDGNSEAIVKSKAGNVTKEELYEAMKDSVGEIVLQQLVFEKALSKEYEVDEKEIDEQINELKALGEEQFNMFLMQSQFKDEDDLRFNMRLNELLNKAAMDRISVSENEVKKYYDEKLPDIKASHILVKDEETALKVKEQLENGGDFAAVSKAFSEDKTADAQGGDLGTISYSDPQLDAAFKEAAFKLEQDEISDPVESQFGFHIIKVTDKPTKEPFEDVKADYEKELKLSKIDGTVMQEALKDVLEKADVKIADKDLEDTFDTFLGKEEEK